MENQLNILSESLDKKLEVLARIQEYNSEQEKVFTSSKVDMSTFDEAVEKKQQLIDELEKLDEGFETMYRNLAEQLEHDKAQYADQIREIQGKIKAVLDLSVSIQVQEDRNKQLIEQYFARERKGLQQSRKTSTAAYNYYKSAAQSEYRPSQFVDSKQ